jgi:hypothetical protein
VVCSYCEKTQRVKANGTVRRHGRHVLTDGEVKWCQGSGTKESGHQLAPLPYDEAP